MESQNPPSNIYKVPDFTGPMPTNDWWSSVAWEQYSFEMYPFPLSVKCTDQGVEVAQPGISPSSDYVSAIMTSPEITVGATGLTFDNALVGESTSWSVDIVMPDGGNKMVATISHGSPYVYFTYSSGEPKLSFESTPTVWRGDSSSRYLGITISGNNYGLFAPSGSSWSGLGSSTFTCNLPPGDNYFSVALLPDGTESTLDNFEKSAYAFISDTTTSWSYNKSESTLRTTFNVETSVKEGSNENTIMSLFPHQWENNDNISPLPYTYDTLRGIMKTIEGNTFSTLYVYNGIIPWLPDKGTYDRSTLNDYLEQADLSTDGGTYWGGKDLGRVANVLPIAEQLNNNSVSQTALDNLKTSLEDWLTASPGETDAIFYHNNNWGTLLGYPTGYGADTNLNDHHFHYGYHIYAAAAVAMRDEHWAARENWGAMVNMLIKDYACWDRDNEMFPFLRNFDPYEGHSWSDGSAAFDAGNNQESSSEAINSYAALILWGEATSNTEIRDLGIYLYLTEVKAVHNYWFDIYNKVFEPGYGHLCAGIVWGGKYDYGTWFSGDPGHIHGINFLPVCAHSLYLGHDTDYVVSNYEHMVSEGGTAWKDINYEFLALADAQRALNNWSNNITPEEGESKAHTYHWLHNFNVLGHVETSVKADTPLYAVFKKDNLRRYVVYNAGGSPITVHFSDGREIWVPANSMEVENRDLSITDDGPPASFDLLTPSDEVTVPDNTPTLIWEASSDDDVGLSHYEVWLDDSNVDNVDAQTTEWTTPSLSGSHNWYIIAVDGMGKERQSSSTYTFTIGTVPDEPSLYSPTDGTVTSDNTPSFEWENGSNAENHRLLVDNDPDFSPPVENRVIVGDNSYTIAPENSLPDDNYSWKVVAVNDSGENESGVWTFVIDTQPPSAPALHAPGSGVVTGDSTPKFGWENVSGSGSLITYKLEIDNDSDFGSATIYEPLSENYKTSDPLSDDLYYWRVTARDNAGNRSDYSENWVLTVDTASPGISSTTPDNEAVGVTAGEDVVVVFDESMDSDVSPSLSQTDGTDPGGWSGPVWSTTSVENDTATWSHDDWSSGETVSLKISDYEDLAGNVGDNYEWSFTISGDRDTTPPGVPSDLSASSVSSSQIDLDWSDVSASDLDHYNVYRGLSSGFSVDPSSLVGSPGSSNFSDTELSDDTTYYYKVTSVDNSGNESGPSDEVSATTDDAEENPPTGGSDSGNTSPSYTLSTSANPPDGGFLEVNPVQETYEDGTEVTITATPDENHKFDHWSGDASGTDNTVTITMDSDKSVTANFIPVYRLTVSTSPAEGGSVNITPLKDAYENGVQVTLIATPEENYEFTGWSDGDWIENNQVAITMNSDKSVTAHFTEAINQYNLSTSIGSGSGTITLSPSGGIYDEGTTVTVTADPDSGYQFDHWSGDLTGSDSTQSLPMNSDKSVTANFVKKESENGNHTQVWIGIGVLSSGILLALAFSRII